MAGKDNAPSERTTVRRMAVRGEYEKSTVAEILDEGLIAHVGLSTSSGPIVVPMLYGREGDILYLHGSPASRILREGGNAELCVTVTLLDGIVVARSLMHHSMNYRSVVVIGEAHSVDDLDERARSLDVISEHVIPGRVAGTRPHHEREVKSTLVLSMSINEASAKIRTGPPIDDEEEGSPNTSVNGVADPYDGKWGRTSSPNRRTVSSNSLSDTPPRSNMNSCLLCPSSS